MSVVMEKEFTLTKDMAVRYLNLYTGEAKWVGIIDQMYIKAENAVGRERAKVSVKKAIAFAVMLPSFDRTRVTDPPENLLRGGHGYDQYNERDWIGLLQQQIEKDKEIEVNRNKCLSLGIIYPIEYSPLTRQAFNWLYARAEEAGVVTSENKKEVIKRFQNLVVAYGGAVICSVFNKEDWKINKKILNWRSNYFFEKLIYETYTPEQIFKIKKQELTKTNPRLVKSVRTD